MIRLDSMDDGNPTYTYAPLDASKRQIRLLHLHPISSEGYPYPCLRAEDSISQSSEQSQDDKLSRNEINRMADIHCNFSFASLSEQPDYEALSYVWGDQTDLATIYVHGYPFSITRNLYDALIHMRCTTTRILWVDALCINQADLQERASQVILMGSIFRQAHNVVVYLGYWNNADAGFRTIEAIGTDALSHHRDAAEMSALFRRVGLELHPFTASRYIIQFFSLPWWSRVWTVQEYVLAIRVMFQSGHYLLSRTSFDSMIFSFYNHVDCCVRGGGTEKSWLANFSINLTEALAKGRAMCDLRDVEWRREVPNAIAMSRGRECSNALDKIYGFLGLTDASFQAKIQPDYSSTPRAVYTSATVACIDLSQTLNVLSYVRGPRTVISSIPSYVLDFTAEVTPIDTTFGIRNSKMLPIFHASGTSTPRILLLPSRKVRTQAMFIDTIRVNVDDDMFTHWINADGPQESKSEPQRLLQRYGSPTDACWQTVCGGLVPCAKTKRYRPVQDSDYAKYQEWRALDDVNTADEDVYAINVANYLASTGRHFVVTSSGYLGLVSRYAREGDCVVLMPGGKVPYLLRRLGDADDTEDRTLVDSEQYEFLGDCYIHGIMYGEAWDESKLQDIILV